MIITGKESTLLDYSAYWWTSDTFSTNLVDRTPTRDLYRVFRQNQHCPYCDIQTALILKAFMPGPEYDPAEERIVRIYGCLSCGWWHEEFTRYDFTFPGWERIKRTIPYLREFSVDSESIPIQTLSSEILLRPNLIHQVNPKKLENFVASVLSDFFDTEVSVLGRSGDGGIDLVYVQSKVPFAVQVKRRASIDRKEGVSLVREFLGACTLSEHRNACIVTTAKDFTSGAKKAAQKAIELKSVDSFDLISRDKFLSLFRRTNLAHKYPWTPTVKGWIRDWKDSTGTRIESQKKYLK